MNISAPYYLTYSIVVFVMVLIAGTILDLLKRHYIFQLAGIVFFFSLPLFRLLIYLKRNSDITAAKLCNIFLPPFMGLSACLISMLLGFWVFPFVRKLFKD